MLWNDCLAHLLFHGTAREIVVHGVLLVQPIGTSLALRRLLVPRAVSVPAAYVSCVVLVFRRHSLRYPAKPVGWLHPPLDGIPLSPVILLRFVSHLGSLVSRIFLIFLIFPGDLIFRIFLLYRRFQFPPGC